MRNFISLIKWSFSTSDDKAIGILRILFAVSLIPNGIEKTIANVMPVLNDPICGPTTGFDAFFQCFTSGYHIPPFFAFMGIITQVLFSWTLLVGVFTRISAMLWFCIMLWLIPMEVHDYVSFIGYTGYKLLIAACAIFFMIKGSGKWSFDNLIYKKYLAISP
ncbi:DoxX family protein [Photobacterium leiognathi]|uniref:DoxX family protein n=1 Tax=Photobacterium leiognathi TaxID=553611 RepID=UPI002739F474|nr:DoxX family protein [Photobacterium leiognathi]